MLASFRENRLTTISPEKREQLLRGSYCFAWADAEPPALPLPYSEAGKTTSHFVRRMSEVTGALNHHQ